MRSIPEMVRHQQVARFTHYRDQQLWYVTECGFAFPVPISDIGEATFQAEEKAVLLLRYLRPQHKLIMQARAEAAQEAV
jgi:hypothetical protein